METPTEKTVAALNSLIIINNDRYEGYKTAAEETDDVDLKLLFTRFSTQSKRFSNELQKLIPFTEEGPDKNETTTSGKLYRVWMDIKAAVTAKDRKSILSSCEFGEDVAKKTYEEVLEHPEDISSDLLTLIRKQKSEILEGHDHVKALRDSA